MLTIKAEVRKEQARKDGSCNVKIRFIQNRKIKRLPTKLFAKKSDLNKSFELKEGTAIKKEAGYLIFYYEKICSQLPVDIEQCSIEDIVAYIEADKKKWKSRSRLTPEGKVLLVPLAGTLKRTNICGFSRPIKHQ